MTTTLQPGQITFIAAKNHSPVSPPALLPREKFNDLLHGLEPVSLLLVHAPAGYGKTTTIAERLASLEARAAWLRLEILVLSNQPSCSTFARVCSANCLM